MTTAEQDQEQDSRPQLLCESDDIVVIYNSTEKEVFHWFVKKEDSELTGQEWNFLHNVKRWEPPDRGHHAKAIKKQQSSWSPSEQWFDTCLDNHVPVVFCISLTWLCDSQLSAIVCFVCHILDLFTILLYYQLSDWTFMLNFLAAWIHVMLI